MCLVTSQQTNFSDSNFLTVATRNCKCSHDKDQCAQYFIYHLFSRSYIYISLYVHLLKNRSIRSPLLKRYSLFTSYFKCENETILEKNVHLRIEKEEIYIYSINTYTIPSYRTRINKRSNDPPTPTRIQHEEYAQRDTAAWRPKSEAD